jgi:hypothetical protein
MYIYKQMHIYSQQKLDMWTLSPETRKIVETKGAGLGTGERGWVRPNMRIFTKSFQMKGVDWLNLSRGAALNMFEGHIGEGLESDIREKQVEGWEAILTIFHMCCVITCNVDGKIPTQQESNR